MGSTFCDFRPELGLYLVPKTKHKGNFIAEGRVSHILCEETFELQIKAAFCRVKKIQLKIWPELYRSVLLQPKYAIRAPLENFGCYNFGYIHNNQLIKIHEVQALLKR